MFRNAGLYWYTVWQFRVTPFVHGGDVESFRCANEPGMRKFDFDIVDSLSLPDGSVVAVGEVQSGTAKSGDVLIAIHDDTETVVTVESIHRPGMKFLDSAIEGSGVIGISLAGIAREAIKRGDRLVSTDESS